MSRTLIILIAMLLASGGCRPAAEPLPRLYELPAEAKLVSMRGERVTLGDLRGSVTIYDFIFTRCRGICPLLSQRLAKVAAGIERDAPIRFASISVDPAHDTPQVLAAYAKQYGADPRWTFYTGDRDEIVALSVKGFKLAAGEPTSNPDEPILHSTKFVLADAAGVIRGYYDSNDAAALDALARDARRLAEEIR